MKKRLIVFILIFSFIYISRFAVYVVSQNVGVEHDSGWYLGVARNLAEKGIYASYTNTIGGGDSPGAHPSIHGRFSVQDRGGYSYFPAGVTVGPGFILPQALVYRIFGVGDWQNRTVSFVAFSLLVVLLCFLVYGLGGVAGLLLFELWLWLYPQLFLDWSFEAFSEHLALLYLLAGYFFLLQWLRTKQNALPLILAGLFVSFSSLTKNLYLIGAIPPLIYLFQFGEEKQRARLKNVCFFLLSYLTPMIAFEAYRFFVLFSKFGWDGYVAINKDVYLTMKCCGSGILQFLEHPFPIRFMIQKLFVWEYVGMHPIIVVAILASGTRHLFRNRNATLLLMFCLLFFGWFFILSSTGFFRHAWPSIIVGGVLLCSNIPTAARRFRSVVIVLFVAILFISPHIIPSYLITNNRLSVVRTHTSDSSGPVFIHTFPLSDQLTIQTYVNGNVSARIRMCYDETLLVAELPLFVNRAFFPLARCKRGDILIVGPYQKQFLIRSASYLPALLKNKCGRKLFENASYTLCEIH